MGTKDIARAYEKMTGIPPKIAIFEQFARIGQALSSGPRLALLELLAQSERSVDTLASMAELTVANTSRHLQQLRQAGLVVGRKEGQFVYYRIAGDEVLRLLAALWAVGETYSADIDRLITMFLVAKDSLDPLSAEEVLDRAKRGIITILDVRPNEEYAAGHLPGAINIPLPELHTRLHELPARREIVAYCRGPYCLMSLDALLLLRKAGRKARRLRDGLPEWRARGMPVE
jgi:rhodanese-related sulfurtransferase/DNA-binding transcriptional ArsR family regulator